MTREELLESEWQRCAHWIESALPHGLGLYDIEDIHTAVHLGHMQLWPGERSALVTELTNYPAKTVCTVLFAGGDLDELRESSKRVTAWAKDRGADLMLVYGRKGWSRALGVGRIASSISVQEI